MRRLESMNMPAQNELTERRFGRSVSIDQAAEMLGVSRRTIYNRIRTGRLQTVRTLGGSQRVLVVSLPGHRTESDDRFAYCGATVARRPGS